MRRLTVLSAVVVAAVVVQTSILSRLDVAGVVPDLVLVVVVAIAISEGPTVGARYGLAAGLLLDLAPPADHTLGRWALTLVVVGYLAGLAGSDARQSRVAAAVVVAASSFVGTSMFALSGLVLQDAGVTVARAIAVIPVAVLLDVLLALAVVPLVRALAVPRVRDHRRRQPLPVGG